MLDVSEGGLDTVTVPEGGSPCSYVRSHSRSLHPPSVGGHDIRTSEGGLCHLKLLKLNHCIPLYLIQMKQVDFFLNGSERKALPMDTFESFGNIVC